MHIFTIFLTKAVIKDPKRQNMVLLVLKKSQTSLPVEVTRGIQSFKLPTVSL
jgi:hypothetical protein